MLDQTAKLADEFVLTHKTIIVWPHSPNKGRLLRKAQYSKQTCLFLKYWLLIRRQRDCFYCKTPGPIIVVHYVARRKRWGAAKLMPL